MIGNYDKTVPTVYFDSKDLEAFMINFMMESLDSLMSVRQYIGLVMLRLGFKSEDRIELRNFYLNDKNKNIQCVVNDKDYYDIRFDNVGNKKEHTKISLINFNIKTTYECFPLKLSELGVRIIPVSEEIIYADGVKFTRDYNVDGARFAVSYLNYIIELYVSKPYNIELPMYDGMGNYSRYRLDNEDLLIKYMSNFFLVWCNRDIFEVYKNICEFSLGNDPCKYNEVLLKCINNGKITDMIHFKNGELQRLGVTLSNIGRTLFLNSDNSYTYEILDREDLFKFSMNVDDEKTSYNLSVKNLSDISMINEIIQSDILEVNDNIENFKRLVKTKFIKLK